MFCSSIYKANVIQHQKDWFWIPTGFDSILFEFAVFFQILVPIDTIYRCPVEFWQKLMLRTILVDILYYARIPLLSCLPHTAINFDFFNGTWTWSTKTIIPYKTCAKTSEVFVFFVNIYMNFIDKERKRQWERESMCIRSDVFQKSIKIIFIYL